MVQPENQIARLYKDQLPYKECPETAINLCIGYRGEFSTGHRRFVVEKAENGYTFGENGIVAESRELDEVYQITGARPYGSPTLCSSCRKLIGTVINKKRTKWYFHGGAVCPHPKIRIT